MTGAAPTKEQNPAVPYSPAEIATEALRSWRAGTAIVHIHVRDPQSGRPAFAGELFAEAVERIRSKSDVLINLTTHALILGGHVRVGFEDNLYLNRGVKADSNARFVERPDPLALLLDREVASCAEARQILRLPPRKTS